MKQRQKKSLLATGLIALVVLVCCTVWLCLPRGYERLVPAQAKAVVRLEPAHLQQRMGGVRELARSWGFDSGGIDLDQAVFAFITPNEYVGFAAAISDEDLFTRQVEKLAAEGQCLPIEKIGGRQWAWLQAGWMLTWDSRSLLILGPGMATERDVLRQTMSRMIDDSQPFASTDAYDKMMAQGGDAQLFAQLDALPAPYNLLFRLGVPPSCDPASIQVFAHVDLSRCPDGSYRTEIKSELTSDNPDVVRDIKLYEKGKQCIERPTRAETDSTLFLLATCTQGKPLLELLRTDATLRGLLMGLNQTIDADRMLASTNGLLTIEISSLSKDWTPAFCLKAETNAHGLMADADYWMESAARQPHVELEQKGPADFRLKSENLTMDFGLRPLKGLLYFAAPHVGTAADRPWAVSKSHAVEGLHTYFRLNLRKFFAQPCMDASGATHFLKSLMPGSHALIYEGRTGGKALLRIE